MKLVAAEAQTILKARTMKERACRRGPRDVPPTIELYRGDTSIAVIGLPDHGRNSIFRVMTVAAGGFDADVVSSVFECYCAVSSNTNPVTGKNWAAGEMDEAVKEHGAIEKGWLTETLAITVVNRAGDSRLALLPFRFSGKHLVWDDAQTTGPEVAMASGAMVDFMVKAMSDKSFSQTIHIDGDAETTRATIDAMTAEYLSLTLGCRVALTCNVQEKDRLATLMGRNQAGSRVEWLTVPHDPI